MTWILVRSAAEDESLRKHLQYAGCKVTSKYHADFTARVMDGRLQSWKCVSSHIVDIQHHVNLEPSRRRTVSIKHNYMRGQKKIPLSELELK